MEYIVKHGRLDENGGDARRIFRQIVEAVAKCHEKNFVHRLNLGFVVFILNRTTTVLNYLMLDVTPTEI